MDKFKKYADNTSFLLHLSKQQLEAICIINAFKNKKTPAYWLDCSNINMKRMYELEDKGLIEWLDNTKITKHVTLTKYGKMVVDLIIECGIYPKWLNEIIINDLS